MTRLVDLAPIVTSTAEKLEDALKQLADLQRIAVSEQGVGDRAEGVASGRVRLRKTSSIRIGSSFARTGSRTASDWMP